MGRKRLLMNSIREVMKLSEKKYLSIRQIHRALNIARTTVSKYVKAFQQSGLLYEDIKDLSDAELFEILGLKNVLPSVRLEELSRRFPKYTQELTRVGVTRYILWSEYISDNPDGYSYSQFCFHFQKWTNASKLSMRIDHKAGDKMYVDFTGKKMSYIEPETGMRHETEIFVAILPASNLIYVEPVMSQKKHDWIYANQNAFLYFGGVTKAIVPDCLKSGVTKGNKYEPTINPEYSDFAGHCNTVILPARPYKPKDKAMVEQAVRIVYQSIFANLRDRVFHSLNELKEAVKTELQKLNSRPMQHFQKSRFELFNEIEKKLLQPLPAERYERKYFKRLKVQSNYYIYLSDDNHYYSVPYNHRNKRVYVIYTDKTVEIYLKNVRIAFHKRVKTSGHYSTNPDHMPPQHKYIHDWSPEKFIDKAELIGSETAELVKQILAHKKHPEQAYKICSGIIALSTKYSVNEMEKAGKFCLKYNKLSYKEMAAILKNGVENLLTEDNLTIEKLPEHSNIRGREYYISLNNQNNIQGEEYEKCYN